MATVETLKEIVVGHCEIWLLGLQTTEVWHHASDVAFPFHPRPVVDLERAKR